MIPHLLHQIWLGGEPPAQVQTWIAGWRALHPGWDHRLWTDDNRPRLDNETAFQRAPSWAMKADLLRYELLRDQGGVYIDADFECHRPIDSLVGERSLLLVSEFGVVCNEFMGAERQSSFLAHVVTEVGRSVEAAPDARLASPHLITGPYFLDRLYAERGLAFSMPDALLPGDYFFPPRTRVPQALARASTKRYATHHALASWQDKRSLMSAVRRTKLRTRVNRFIDLGAQ